MQNVTSRMQSLEILNGSASILDQLSSTGWKGTIQIHIIRSSNKKTYNYHKYGVANAMAQPYNHVIMPLAKYRDKLTQVRWGIADFQYRFGHKPDGMWLPETAVDNETLEVMADCGIKFTISGSMAGEDIWH